MRRVMNKIDKPLLVVTIISLILGVLMVGSASSLKSYMKFGESYYYLKRQIIFVIIGLIVGFVIIKTPSKRYKGLIKIAVFVRRNKTTSSCCTNV